MEHKSELARLMQQIDAEYESGKSALQGLSYGAARHDFITKRMEHMAQCIEELRAVVGEAVAIQLMIEWQDRMADSGQTQHQ
jgi:hypothetical protein